MKPDFNICDVCEARVNRGLTLFLATDRVMDGAGDMETLGESIDLCHVHAVQLLKELADRPLPRMDEPYALTKHMLSLLKRKQQK